ncbi:bacillithiol system redox-active protein YtxJ [Gorillibacterium sp. sgz500922]|uniref:bacillithiol system redox-active protein YtxJ n=1 Tax=Gorillibacterium sp. sgz500922 TaxID=3446694 RepID=UPI003F673F99
MKWTELTTADEWAKARDESKDQTVVVFKHSTTCPVSANAYREFESYLADKPDPNAQYYLVKVIESRPVSNRIAEDTGIKHESPQIICLKKQEPYWNASHWSITKAHMSAVLDE